MKTELLSPWGDDLTVVNNARVSFSKESSWIVSEHQPPYLSKVDQNLIGYLARGCTKGDWEAIKVATCAAQFDTELDDVLNHVKNMPTHWAPFANGVGMRFRLKAPFPIMRQVFKHKVGSVESEVSRRYVSDTPEVFYPEFREAAASVKQGSGGVLQGEAWERATLKYRHAVSDCVSAYEALLELGVCPEQARFVLPQGTYTEAIVSNSLYGWANFYNQRADTNHAQKEIADIAEAVSKEAKRLFPVSWAALTQQQ